MLFEIVWNGFEIKRRQEKEIDPHKKAIQFGPCSAWVRFFFIEIQMHSMYAANCFEIVTSPHPLFHFNKRNV